MSPPHAQLQPIGDVSATGTNARAPELVAIAGSSSTRAEDNRAELTMRPAQRARADAENTYWTNTGPAGGWVRPRSTLGERWRVDKVAWASWGDPVATGSGNATLFSDTRDASGGRGISPPIPVTVTLSDVADCLGTRVYTSMAVLPAEGATVPAEFSASARVSISRPCVVVPQICAGRAACRRSIEGIDRDRVVGRLDDLFHTRIFPVAMRWRGLGSSRAVGRGYLNTKIVLGSSHDVLQNSGAEPHVYGTRFTLSAPRWCGGAMRYTRLEVVVLGKGRARPKLASQDQLPSRAARRALDRAPIPKRVVNASRGGGYRWVTSRRQVDRALAGCDASARNK